MRTRGELMRRRRTLNDANDPLGDKRAVIDEWAARFDRTHSDLERDIKSTLTVGWRAAAGHNSREAVRTAHRLEVLAWLQGDTKLEELAASAPFKPFGAPVLAAVMNATNARRPVDERLRRMGRGLPCVDGCEVCG